MAILSIGELSKRTGVKVVTIRYYEKIGLIDTPSRTDGNQRCYRQSDLQRLSFIRHARELGFTLNDIRELLVLSHDLNKPCQEAHIIASSHLKSVKQRIAKLKRLERELNRIEALVDNGHAADCRVIQALADHSLCKTKH